MSMRTLAVIFFHRRGGVAGPGAEMVFVATSKFCVIALVRFC